MKILSRVEEISQKGYDYLDRMYESEDAPERTGVPSKSFKDATGLCEWEGCEVVFVRTSSNQKYCKKHQKLINNRNSKEWYWKHKGQNKTTGSTRKKYTFRED